MISSNIEPDGAGLIEANTASAVLAAFWLQ
jgi:hypothetical protein